MDNAVWSSFFVLWRNRFDWNHEMQFFQDINYVKGFQEVLLSNADSQLLYQLYSVWLKQRLQ